MCFFAVDTYLNYYDVVLEKAITSTTDPDDCGISNGTVMSTLVDLVC